MCAVMPGGCMCAAHAMPCKDCHRVPAPLLGAASLPPSNLYPCSSTTEQASLRLLLGVVVALEPRVCRA